MLQGEHSAILLTCINRKLVSEDQFSVFLRVAVLHRFCCIVFLLIQCFMESIHPCVSCLLDILSSTQHSAVSSKSICRSRGREFYPGLVPYLRGNHEIISMVILLLLLIQEGLFSVTNESMCAK